MSDMSDMDKKTSYQDLFNLKSWSGEFNEDTFEIVLNLLRDIFKHPCTCIEIVKSMENVYVQTSQTAKEENGELIHPIRELSRPNKGGYIWWSIGGYHTFIWTGENSRVSWYDRVLKIKKKAPAGHDLIWIYAPEDHDEQGEPSHLRDSPPRDSPPLTA